MKILTTALYSFIIEVLWILNTVRYNWSLKLHPSQHWAATTTDWRLTLPTPLVLSLNQVISYKPWTTDCIAAQLYQLNGIIVSAVRPIWAVSDSRYYEG